MISERLIYQLVQLARLGVGLHLVVPAFGLVLIQPIGKLPHMLGVKGGNVLFDVSRLFMVL
jgi:hypothetical protein